ncbi:hypothetical protein J2T60_002011 [Natronospira proteinivora]|uniref:PrcB C-terminal domain-containing protein n=1 Tax=Natronospira proteinivora TaxID=1807133 RepID=A0ABT1G9S8_9GAMM|nr:protease complex subunit PrcB family protein [Natronospira proteinivora]MCP1728011.1 hypothetical protein [Natronospira proteinivora]
MNRAGLVLLSMCCIFLSACAAGEGNGQAEENAMQNGSYEIEELARGSQSRESAERMMVVRDADTFERIWDLSDQRGERPAVDFDQSMVVAIFMGERRTGGYSVQVDEVRQDGDDIMVQVIMEEPGEGCMTTQAITRPFQLVLLPQLDGEVRFQTQQQALDC